MERAWCWRHAPSSKFASSGSWRNPSRTMGQAAGDYCARHEATAQKRSESVAPSFREGLCLGIGWRLARQFPAALTSLGIVPALGPSSLWEEHRNVMVFHIEDGEMVVSGRLGEACTREARESG